MSNIFDQEIKKITTMPAHVKGDGGYYYTDDIANHFFEFENKLLYFTENKFYEVPMELYKQIKFKFADVNSKLIKLGLLLTELESNLVNKENIEEIIDSKLASVYSSFEKLSEKFVKENINDALKDSKREASGKLKITSLVIFKELGYSADEIKALAESGLI